VHYLYYKAAVYSSYIIKEDATNLSKQVVAIDTKPSIQSSYITSLSLSLDLYTFSLPLYLHTMTTDSVGGTSTIMQKIAVSQIWWPNPSHLMSVI
jgi:hypothetical protein